MADKSKILNSTSEHVDNLFKKWTHMFDSNNCNNLLHKLEERVNNFYQDLHSESEEKELTIRGDIRALGMEVADINRELNRNLDEDKKPEDMPLLVWYRKLDEKVKVLREELNNRQAKICKLLLQQEELCKELDEPPLRLLIEPLPKPQELSAFCEHLDRLRAERLRRMDKLFQLRSQIKQHIKVLQLVPLTEADERLLSHANQCLTPDIFEKLTFMEEKLKAQVLVMRERIDDMRVKVKMIWKRIPDTDELVIHRVCEAQEYTQRTYNVLHEELQRCWELRRQNLNSIIEQLRTEIEKWWDLTLKSQNERQRFLPFYNQKYDEELLELHEMELDDIKNFYNTNAKIFDLFASRTEIWARMMALEAKANDPSRFNNRGGQLLKEERERKAISSKLPKIEQQIIELVQAYEHRTHLPFLVHGENILVHMANDSMRVCKAKEQQSSTRKTNQPSTSKVLPPPKTCFKAPRTTFGLKSMSNMSTSTVSICKTPTNWELPKGLGSTAKTTGQLRKRKLVHANNNENAETRNAKRNLTNALNSVKPLPTPPNASQRLVSAREKVMKSPQRKVLVLDHTLHRTPNLGRRSVGHRKPVKKLIAPKIRILSPSSDENYESSPEGAYNTFEKEIKSAARSSMMPREFNSSYHEAKQRKRF